MENNAFEPTRSAENEPQLVLTQQQNCTFSINLFEILEIVIYNARQGTLLSESPAFVICTFAYLLQLERRKGMHIIVKPP